MEEGDGKVCKRGKMACSHTPVPCTKGSHDVLIEIKFIKRIDIIRPHENRIAWDVK